MATGERWHDINQLQRDMDDWFGNWREPMGIRTNRFDYPPMNLEVSTECYDYYIFIPGMTPEELDIQCDGRQLTVSGEKPAQHPDPEQYHPYRKERFAGKFKRNINLAEDIDTNAISARYNDGVLHLKALRVAESKPQQINIQSGAQS